MAISSVPPMVLLHEGTLIPLRRWAARRSCAYNVAVEMSSAQTPANMLTTLALLSSMSSTTPGSPRASEKNAHTPTPSSVSDTSAAALASTRGHRCSAGSGGGGEAVTPSA
ncbi:hypothetical protein [Nonomuraea sp. NPDC050202]|uniref:hypothetical protein n=1 Tax=Nonomuraea sp. NPDC050202 TaxID=3155035 RepID=UPI0033E8BEC1